MPFHSDGTLLLSADPTGDALLRRTGHEQSALAIYARCLQLSSWTDRLDVALRQGESLQHKLERSGERWSPYWLWDAGYRSLDSSGSVTDATTPATADGPIRWDPPVMLPRVDDGVENNEPPTSGPGRRRLAGEVALAGLLRRDAEVAGILPDDFSEPASGQQRGERFKHHVALALELRLDAADGWRIVLEVPLTSIRGLHLRRDVGARSADIAVTHDETTFCLISSKASWRSDRGTEAAQLRTLDRYRRDLPYVAVTNEFPRARSLEEESGEDRIFFLLPDYARTWRVINDDHDAALNFPRLADLDVASQHWQGPALSGLNDLVAACLAAQSLL